MSPGSNKHKIVIRGVVTSGLGEGRKYMSIPEYRRQFTEKLGFDPYPGTLNIVLEDCSVRKVIEEYANIIIHGFEKDGIRYGGVKCAKAKIRDIPAAILLIEKTKHPPNIIEVIAPVCLREKLGLKDGDVVEIELETSS